MFTILIIKIDKANGYGGDRNDNYDDDSNND